MALPLSSHLCLLSFSFIIFFSVTPAATLKSTGMILRYHNGPVLSPNITINIIWYGNWNESHKSIIRDYIDSFNAPDTRSPSVADWWRAITFYTDVTGANVSRFVSLGAERHDRESHGRSLTRLSLQSVITSGITAETNPIPADPRGGVYLVLTAEDVYVQDFCQVCGFHLFTFPSIVGFTLPVIWVGNSAKMCPGTCSWPFVVPDYMPGVKPLKAPNGVAAMDGVINIIGHELAEIATNPLGNGWYAGDDPLLSTEVADLCQAIYGVGGGSGYVGEVRYHSSGAVYNMYGTRSRTFMVQWLWSHVVNRCVGNM